MGIPRAEGTQKVRYSEVHFASAALHKLSLDHSRVDFGVLQSPNSHHELGYPFDLSFSLSKRTVPQGPASAPYPCETQSPAVARTVVSQGLDQRQIDPLSVPQVA
jgi:hypothetical protein